VQRTFLIKFYKQEKVNSQKILGKVGGAQLKAQKILVDWGGTQFGTF
jgi:hypothetical protein